MLAKAINAARGAQEASLSGAGEKFGEGGLGRAQEVFSERNEIPIPLIVIMLLGVAKYITWTEELAITLQIIVGMEVLLFFGMSFQILKMINADPERDSKVWAKTEDLNKTVISTTPPVEEVTLKEYLHARVYSARKALIVGLGVALVIPHFAGVQQPILIQLFLIPTGFWRERFFKKYVLGLEYEQITCVTAAQAKEQLDEFNRNQKEAKVAEKTLEGVDKMAADTGAEERSNELQASLREGIFDIARHPLVGKAMPARAAELVSNAVDASNVDVQTQGAGTSLLMALARVRSEAAGPLVVKLLKGGASPTLQDVDGWTALHFAAFADAAAPAKALLEHAKQSGELEALLSATSRDGTSVKALAEQEKSTAVLSVLAAYA